MAERPGRDMGRAGASRFPAVSSSGGSSVPVRPILPSLWQVPGYTGPNELGYAGVSTGYEKYWGLPVIFDRPVRITDMGLWTGNPSGPHVSGDRFADCGIYATDPTNFLQPTTLLHNFRAGDGPAQGFGGFWTESGIAVEIDAGEQVWFTVIYTAHGDVLGGGAALVDCSGQALGSQWDGVTSAGAGNIGMVHGIKKAVAGYGAGGLAATVPADPFPTVTAADYLLHASSQTMPVALFKVTLL